MQVQFLGQEEPLEEVMVTPSSILAWRIPWRGDWQVTDHRVTKSCTQLKQLSTQTYICSANVQQRSYSECLVTTVTTVTQFMPSQRFHWSRVRRVEWEKVIKSGRDAAMRNKQTRMTRS